MTTSGIIDFKIQSILLVVAGIVNLVLGLRVYKLDRDKTKKSNTIFALIAGSVSMWAFSRALFEEVNTSLLIFFSSRVLYLSASLIPILFFLFSLAISRGKIILHRKESIFIILTYFIIVFITIIPNSVIDSITNTNPIKIITFGKMYPLYVVHILGYFIAGFYVLARQFRKSNGVLKAQIKYIFIGTLIPSLIGVMTNLILPTFGFFEFFWLGPITTILMSVIIGYAIIRYNLWEIKLITAEILTTLILMILVFNLLLAKTTTFFFIRGSSLFLAGIFSLFLIKGVKKDIETRERIKELAGDLTKANIHLSDMEQQKTEFVSIASHQLRTPLTAIKGYASMLTEGSFGPLSDEAKRAVEKIFRSSQRLVLIIQDFLMVSRIEQGRVQYSFETIELKNLLKEIINDVKPVAQEKGLSVRFQFDNGGAVMAKVDREKFKQSVYNIIANAISYTDVGLINVLLSNDNWSKKVRIAVSDTGKGIVSKSLENIFEKFSHNGTQGRFGSGIGLFVSREIIKAHRGNVWAESAGPGHGSTFFIELPQWENRKGKKM